MFSEDSSGRVCDSVCSIRNGGEKTKKKIVENEKKKKRNTRVELSRVFGSGFFSRQVPANAPFAKKKKIEQKKKRKKKQKKTSRTKLLKLL